MLSKALRIWKTGNGTGICIMTIHLQQLLKEIFLRVPFIYPECLCFFISPTETARQMPSLTEGKTFPVFIAFQYPLRREQFLQKKSHTALDTRGRFYCAIWGRAPFARHLGTYIFWLIFYSFDIKPLGISVILCICIAE